jgi:non-ribosomal peptide synthetase component F
MTRHFKMLLAGAVAAPLKQLSRLPLMGTEERKLTIETFNATDAPVRSATVHGLFEASAALRPKARCLVGSSSRLSYSEVRSNNAMHS